VLAARQGHRATSLLLTTTPGVTVLADTFALQEQAFLSGSGAGVHAADMDTWSICSWLMAKPSGIKEEEHG
jgi:hypothetical protein